MTKRSGKHSFSNLYSDLYGNPVSLTSEELEFFRTRVQTIQKALNLNVEIVNRDHETAFTGKHKEALGIFYTSDPKNPSEDCFITIDNYFIHECYESEVLGKIKIEPNTLTDVICHELAHMQKFRHCKTHERITQDLIARVGEYRKEFEMQQPRRRYITTGIVDYDGPISAYRLIASNNLGNADNCIRVTLPPDLILKKSSCDGYSTTEDQRSLNELGYDIMVKLNGRWTVFNDLKPIQPHEIFYALKWQGLTPVPKYGYLTKPQLKQWYERRASANPTLSAVLKDAQSRTASTSKHQKTISDKDR